MRTVELIEYLSSAGYSVYPIPNHVPDLTDESKFPCLFIISNGGGATDEYLPIKYPSYQIIVKGKNAIENPEEHTRTEDVAQSIIDLMDQRENFVIGFNTIYYCRSQNSSPLPIGIDLKQRPTYSLNLNFKLQPNLKGVN